MEFQGFNYGHDFDSPQGPGTRTWILFPPRCPSDPVIGLDRPVYPALCMLPAAPVPKS